jgi:DNA repair protein RadD
MTEHHRALRAYQAAVVARVYSAIKARLRRLLVVAATGSGKTVIAASIIKEAVEHDRRVLFLVHRRELTAQTSRKLHDVGVDHGIIQAGFPSRPQAPVQVASVQTLHARAIRGSRIELPPADIVFVDEAHHVRAKTYSEILKRYPNAIIIGLTATPCRADGRGLGNVFDVLIESASVGKLIAEGYLVGTRFYAPVRPNLKGVKVRLSDYVESQLAERMDKPKLVGDIVEHWHRLAERRRTVVFATGVAHSVHIRDEFRRSGVRAEHIDGSTPIEERDDILARLAAGEIDIVCNCMVLTEGWDRPEVSCLVLARPTKSLGLYLQMVGRVLRPFVGKADALILDHSGAVFDHGFPEDPIAWTLEEDQRAANKAHASRGQHHAPQPTTCPECTAVRLEGQPCPACGWRPVAKPKPIEVAEGELGHLGRDGSVSVPYQDKIAFQKQLAWIARERGYKPGWISHKYREKFGVWPKISAVDPAPPDVATRAWIRAGQIAFTKARRPSP